MISEIDRRINSQIISILSAELEGKIIQYRNDTDSKWVDFDSGVTVSILIHNPHLYRIKPEPVTRPWRDSSELPALPIEVRWKDSPNHRTFIAAANHSVIWLGGATSGLSYSQVFEEMEKLDGSPCGVTEEAKQ